VRQASDYLARMLKDVRQAQIRFPDANWDDALAYGQLASKAWLVEEVAKLDRTLGRVDILAGWLGTLSMLMFYDERLSLEHVTSFDIDPACQEIAHVLNAAPFASGRFSAATADIFDLELTGDTVINTSCDHIHPFATWYQRIPHGKLVILQNNDFVEADDTHTNTVRGLDEMIAQAPMSNVLFAGQREFPKYTRFMLIGVR
jgi:hypothetical protein